MFFTLLTTPPALIAQATPPEPQEVLRSQPPVRPLPDGLDQIPVFNSNSPELVLQPGILLSTFPGEGKTHPSAHLNYRFAPGRFDVFAHHIARADDPEDLRTLYMAVLAYNPTDQPIMVDFLSGASYLSQPDAPFRDMAPFVENPHGHVYAGPGSRVMSDLVRGRLQSSLPLRVLVRPRQYQLLLNVPIPVRELEPPLNGRSTYIRMNSNGPLYLASLAQFAPTDGQGAERPPNLTEWRNLLLNSDVAGPRDRAATPPDQVEGPFFYGRVAGVALGSQWQAQLTDKGRTNLAIPPVGGAISYGLSLLHRGRMGTGQVQSAEMVVRYPDTAYHAHGNYGIQYSLDLPLHNPSDRPRTVTVALETPIKQDDFSNGLRFFEPLPRPVFFRGTVQVRYDDDGGRPQNRFYHIIHRRGQAGEPLATITLPPGGSRRVQVDFAYPPDASPPQVLTVQTIR